MRVIVNGAAHDVPDDATVASVVAVVSGQPAGMPQGVAVALNDEVVRRADWATTEVREADRLEVLTAVQGG